jgi:hypothetical protein
MEELMEEEKAGEEMEKGNLYFFCSQPRTVGWGLGMIRARVKGAH